MPDISSFLTYGAIGLGLALAVLAYSLLAKEQKIEKPRRVIVNPIYMFMAFSLVLASAGFVSEYLKSDASVIGKVRDDLADKTKELTELKEQHRSTVTGLESSRKLMRTLMDLKEGKVQRLKELDSKSLEYVSLVAEITSDLERFDRLFSNALSQ